MKCVQFETTSLCLARVCEPAHHAAHQQIAGRTRRLGPDLERCAFVEGTSFQMWTNQALAVHAGTLQVVLLRMCLLRDSKTWRLHSWCFGPWSLLSKGDFERNLLRSPHLHLPGRAMTRALSPGHGSKRSSQEYSGSLFPTRPSNLHGTFYLKC